MEYTWLIFLLRLFGILPVALYNELPVVQKPDAIWIAETSADGKFVVLGGDDSTAWIYETQNYTLHKKHKLSSMILGASWHPYESLLAVATKKGVDLLDMKTAKVNPVSILKDGGRGIGWNYTGELLALADGSGVVQILTKSGKLIRSIKKHNNNGYLTMDWHPKKNIIVTGSDEIILFDTSGQQLNMIKHRKEETAVLTVRWHPSGEFFASGDYGHEQEGMPTLLQFWKEDGTLIKEMKGSKAEYRNIRWNKEGTQLATASDALRIWSVDGKLFHTGYSAENLWGVAWNKNGIITGSFEKGRIRLWDFNAKIARLIN